MSNDELAERFAEAVRACPHRVPWHPARTPAEVLTRLAALAEELDLTWDVYGEGGAVERIETDIAGLLGQPAAVLFPSGIMAQQAALRVWCDRADTRRVALPDLSHLLQHEEDGPRRLHALEVEHLTVGRQLPTADRLAAVPGRLGAVLAELPLRAAGSILPAWEEYLGLAAAARERGVAFHVDGARIWDSQPFYDRPLAEIGAVPDSIYVSLYKGLGGFAGALVATSAEVATELRLWRRRMGGTLYRLTPFAVAGLLGLRDELPRMGEYVAWARAFAAAAGERGLRVFPEVPHISTFLMYAEGEADVINQRLLDHMTDHGVQLTPLWQAAEVPGMAMTEIAVYGAALEFEPADVAHRLAGLLG